MNSPLSNTATGDVPVTIPVQTAGVILFVDDESNILSAMKRLFHRSGYHILIAESGQAALTLLESTPVDLIISDMRMPVMSGAELLQKVRTHWPQTVRILLTGYSDMHSTISAINEGQIHRYIAKPWNDDDLLVAVKDVFERKALESEKNRLEALTARQNEELKSLNATLEHKVAERTIELTHANDRLKRNHLHTIKTFSHLIELRGGHLVGHARKVADLAKKTARVIGLDEAKTQEVFIAGLLHDIGHIGFSDQLLSKPVTKMTPEELTRYQLHPVFGEQSLMGLDDMQTVASLIRSHHERHDGNGFPDRLEGEAIPMGARILSVIETYEDLLSGHVVINGMTEAEALTLIKRGSGSQFDPLVVKAFIPLIEKPVSPQAKTTMSINTDELKPGMVLGADFLSDEGALLLAVDHVLTQELIGRIRYFEKRIGRPLQLSIKYH